MEFLPQKVLHLDKELSKKNPKLSGHYLITEKIEGWYVYFLFNNVTKKWSGTYSSANRKLPSFEWLDVYLNEILPKPDYNAVLIAEAYIPGVPFKVTNGLFNRSVGDCACKDVVFHLHDLVNLDLNTKAFVRYKSLETFFARLRAGSFREYFELSEVLLFGEYDQKLWLNAFETVVVRGGEGIVAKSAQSGYQQGKRNSDLLKLKHEVTVDCTILGIEETTGEMGKYGLTLISLTPDNVEVRTVINSIEMQDKLSPNIELYKGKLVEIKAMEVFKESGKLRQPVFVRLREDL